jgi:hypothetical protein
MKFHIIHKWAKWSAPFESSMPVSSMAQARCCETCGRVHIKKIRSPWNWWVRAATVIGALGEKS